MAPMNGRAIGQGLGQGMKLLANSQITGEIIYSFVIIVCSLMIYFGTKEIYKLSSHRGIKYFRQSFLFFALAYFFRSFIKIILLYFNVKEIRSILPIFGNTTIFLFVYFSSMAIFYLLYSVIWKKLKWGKTIYLFHLTAFIIATTILLFRNPAIYLLTNIILLIFILVTVYISYNQSKKKKAHNLYAMYLLLFIFWILNILDVLIPNMFGISQLFIYLTSLGIFLLILYKVLKKTG